MNVSNSHSFLRTSTTALLMAAVTMLAACDQVVSSANAASVSAPVSNAAVYFGDEYSAEQQALISDANSQAPTF